MGGGGERRCSGYPLVASDKKFAFGVSSLSGCRYIWNSIVMYVICFSYHFLLFFAYLSVFLVCCSFVLTFGICSALFTKLHKFLSHEVFLVTTLTYVFVVTPGHRLLLRLRQKLRKSRSVLILLINSFFPLFFRSI